MAVEYTMAAHPTMYAGVRFRSRLEATWAAFFDLLEWKWEYEPFDLGKWSPDFLIKGAGRDALVEVKPITAPDADVLMKITEAAGDNYNLILCGLAPDDRVSPHIMALWSSCCCAGRFCWLHRPIAKLGTKYDLIFGHGDSHDGFVTGVNIEVDHVHADELDGEGIAFLWGAAKNKTQWRPR